MNPNFLRLCPLLLLAASPCWAVHWISSQTGPSTWTYTLQLDPEDNFNISQSPTTITMTGLSGVTAAGAPSSSDYSNFPCILDWTPQVLGGGTKVVWTNNNCGSGNFPVAKHVYGFTITAPGAMNGTASFATSGFQVDGNGPNLDISGTIAGPSACSVGTPQITSVNYATDFGGFANFSSGSYLEVKGSNLALDQRQWATADFQGVNAPTALDGSKVSIDGIPGYVSYISGQQINVQAPADTATGAVPVIVSNCAGASNTFTLQKNAVTPGMLAPASFKVGKQYLAALFASDLNQGVVTFVGNTGLVAGASFRPAKPNDVVVMYGLGFGSVTPATPPGVVASGSTNVSGVSISFGSIPAAVGYSGLYPNFVGLYEFYVTVPNVPDGDSQINISVNGTNVPQTLFLTVQH